MHDHDDHTHDVGHAHGGGPAWGSGYYSYGGVLGALLVVILLIVLLAILF
jgi:hypothetical protein